MDICPEGFLTRSFCLCAVVLFALTACNSSRSTSGHIEPSLRKLIPADAVFLAGANFDVLKQTAAFQKYSINLPSMSSFTRETGLDPLKDFSEAISVSNGKEAAVLVRGHFAVADLERHLKEKGATRTDYAKHAVFGDARNSVAFLSDSTAVAGSTEIVHEVLDGKTGLPDDLQDLIKAVRSTDQIWAVMAGGLGAFNNVIPDGNAGQILRNFQGVQTIRMGLDLRNGLDLQGQAVCDTYATAKRIRDALKGFVGLGRLSTPDSKPDLLRLFDAIQTEQNGLNVDLTAKLPSDLVERFLDLWLGKSATHRP